MTDRAKTNLMQCLVSGGLLRDITEAFALYHTTGAEDTLCVVASRYGLTVDESSDRSTVFFDTPTSKEDDPFLAMWVSGVAVDASTHWQYTRQVGTVMVHVGVAEQIDVEEAEPEDSPELSRNLWSIEQIRVAAQVNGRDRLYRVAAEPDTFPEKMFAVGDYLNFQVQDGRLIISRPGECFYLGAYELNARTLVACAQEKIFERVA